MRIRELLENKDFKDDDFIKKGEDGEDINYDLVEDLAFYMNNDDDVYRRHVYPSVARCVDGLQAKQKVSHGIFAPAVKECYKSYIKKFPVRHLPLELDDKVVEEVCKKMKEDICKDFDDGKYKD